MNPQDLKDLKQLIEFLKEYQVAEFDLERGDLKIRLKFGGQPAPAAELPDLARVLVAAVPAASNSPAASGAAPAPASAQSGEPPAVSAAAPAAEAGLHIVKSPIVGTFYGSPSPGAPPFVSVGDRVDKGQVICIVEAMKLMNEIESDAAGEIVKCFVTNGQPIEFGQPLFSIRTG
jgi:acetyl-CoA carboxylase biotin carboxyl carrier protein